MPTPNNRQTRVPPTSAGNLLWLIRSGQARTRAEVQTITGLSRSTVAARLDALIGAGYLRDSTRDSSTGGRPAALLEFDASVKVVLAADLGATHARLAAMDVSGDVLATCSDALRIADGPKPVLDWVASQFQAMLAGIGREPADVCGIGVGVPGPVEFDVGRVRKPPIMPGWDDYPIIRASAAPLARRSSACRQRRQPDGAG